jgi:hypothetical protein
MEWRCGWQLRLSCSAIRSFILGELLYPENIPREWLLQFYSIFLFRLLDFGFLSQTVGLLWGQRFPRWSLDYRINGFLHTITEDDQEIYEGLLAGAFPDLMLI